MLEEPRVEGTITVTSGRRLGFSEFGSAGGRPVVWMHGTPGARRQIPQSARLAAHRLGVRIVGIDRPGVGDSTPHLYSSLLEFTPDLVEIADRLDLGRFAMLGLSGGGPYVLAGAYAMPDRVVVGGVLGGVAPTRGPDAQPGGLVGLLEPLAPLVASLRVPLAVLLGGGLRVSRPLFSPTFDLYARLSPEADRRVFSRPEMKAMFLDDLLRGSSKGMAAPIYDLILFWRDWGFSVRGLTVPVRWWHGDADQIVPLSHGENLVSLIPDAKLFVRPGESHLGNLDAAEEVLTTLVTVWDKTEHR